MERDHIISILAVLVASISTHTLTWSVTKSEMQAYAWDLISTHTLTWSVTVDFLLFKRGLLYFNSHAHVERDKL